MSVNLNSLRLALRAWKRTSPTAACLPDQAIVEKRGGMVLALRANTEEGVKTLVFKMPVSSIDDSMRYLDPTWVQKVPESEFFGIVEIKKGSIAYLNMIHNRKRVERAGCYL